jgi:ABC-type bacteriocin/lantibiotic exporter with double-glycine peptidase domain
MGREDLVAAGSGSTYRARVRERTAAWGRLQLRASAGNALLGRAPGLIALALGAAVYALIRPEGTLVELAVPGAILPPLGGILMGIAEYVQIEPRTRDLTRVLNARKEPIGKPPASAVLPIFVDGLTVRFGEINALNGVSFTIERPSLVVFAGPNGSGKSTVLRALLGIVESQGGTIGFGGMDLTNLDLMSLRRRTSYLSQRPHFPAMAPVLEAMSVQPERAYAALDRVNVTEALRTHSPTEPLGVSIDTLSGGERQRVALARSLLRDVELYLFDEADANLDRRGIEMVVSILKELSKHSVVIVAAHTQEVIAAADVVVNLEKGRVVTSP